MGKDLFGEEEKEPVKKLKDWFVVAPFSILNSASKDWQEKKKIWMLKINDTAQTRSNKLRCRVSEGYTGSIEFMNIKGDITSILDPVLCEVLLSWFTEDNHICFDPFAGDAVFGFVSSYKDRIFKGIELRKEQVLFNQTLLDTFELNGKYYCDTSENMDSYIDNESCDFIFSCPPYADLEIYSDDPKDLSTMGYDEFFNVIGRILTNTYKKLKNNRFACIVIGEVRHKTTGEYIGIVPNVINIMRDAGYKYYNEMILKTPIGNLHMRAGRYMNKNRKVGKMHQNVLVFYKGNLNHIKNNFTPIKNES
jgi:DNA modification methylase